MANLRSTGRIGSVSICCRRCDAPDTPFVRDTAAVVRNITSKFFLLAALTATLPSMARADTKAGEDKSRLCDICHNNASHDGGLAPLLQGQPAQYLFIQLKAFKDKRRATGGMDINTSGMTEEDMRDIGEYFAAQELPQTPFKPDPAKVETRPSNC